MATARLDADVASRPWPVSPVGRLRARPAPRPGRGAGCRVRGAGVRLGRSRGPAADGGPDTHPSGLAASGRPLRWRVSPRGATCPHPRQPPGRRTPPGATRTPRGVTPGRRTLGKHRCPPSPQGVPRVGAPPGVQCSASRPSRASSVPQQGSHGLEHAPRAPASPAGSALPPLCWPSVMVRGRLWSLTSRAHPISCAGLLGDLGQGPPPLRESMGQ